MSENKKKNKSFQLSTLGSSLYGTLRKHVNSITRVNSLKHVNSKLANLKSPRSRPLSRSRPSSRSRPLSRSRPSSRNRPLSRSRPSSRNNNPVTTIPITISSNLAPLAPIKIPSPGSIAPMRLKPYTYKKKVHAPNQKMFRLNINLQNKNTKLLKRKLPILVLRRKIENIYIMFDELIHKYKNIFYYKYEYNEQIKVLITYILDVFKEDIINVIDNIKSIILDKTLVKPNTPLYNYYNNNMDNIKYEIENTLLNIKITNGRVVRFQLKQLKLYINHYFKDILN